ncbi:hypothetical protein V1281_003142 [Nitrobacteraceae bacterium AZCC 2161]
MKRKKTTTPSSNGKPLKEVVLAPAERDVPRAAFTIKEFCAAHRISEAMYFKLRTAGLGPREMRALRKVIISVEAAADWRREREIAAQ